MIDLLGWQGTFEIQVRNKDTGEIKTEIIKNRVMNEVLNQLADALVGDAPDLEIKYFSVGTSSAAVADTQTQLGAEIFRTAPISGPTRTATGQIETEFTILDSEAVATIEEIGIFGGTTASASANTGTLISRILWHKVKTSSEEIIFKRIDKVVRS